MQQINLYQDQFRARRDALDARHLALYLLAACVALAGASAYLQWRARDAAARADVATARRDAAQHRLEAVQAALGKAQAAGGPNDETTRLQAQLDAKLRLLDYLVHGPLELRTGFSPFLRGLARQHVPDLWLDGIRIAAGGGRLRLEGHALAPRRVPALIAALGDEAAYAGHTFRTLSIERPEDADWRVDFVLASEAEKPTARKGKHR